MPRWSFLVLFLLIVLSVLGGLHYYLWARLIRDPAWPAPWSRGLTWSLLALALSLPTALILGRAVPSIGRVLAWPAFVWMGLMFLLFVAVLMTDTLKVPPFLLRRLTEARSGEATAVDDDRRRWMARVLAAGGAAAAAIAGGWATRNAVGQVGIKRVEIRLSKLSSAQEGFRLVQLTDIHVGPTIGSAFLEDVVRRTNELRPDLVAITGDLVDGSVADLRAAVAPLKNLRARHGVYFVTGNHEYFSGATAWVTELGQLGIRVLRNERVRVGDGDASFDLAGTDDPTAHRYPDDGHGEDLPKALAGRDLRRPVVLLAHQPKTVTQAARHGVDLQLSGHTHGGQIWPFRYAVLLQQPVVSGLARFGETQIYVSRGTGYWGPPMRLAAPSEITEITLRGPA